MREVRRTLELLQGEADAVYVTHYGRSVAVVPDYERLLVRLEGLHREIWDDVDTDAYLQGEGDVWESCGVCP